MRPTPAVECVAITPGARCSTRRYSKLSMVLCGRVENLGTSCMSDEPEFLRQAPKEVRETASELRRLDSWPLRGPSAVQGTSVVGIAKIVC